MRTKLVWIICSVLALFRFTLAYKPTERYFAQIYPHAMPHVGYLWYRPRWYLYLDDVILIFILFIWPAVVACTKQVPRNWFIAMFCLICSPVIACAMNGSPQTFHQAKEWVSIFVLVIFGEWRAISLYRGLKAGTVTVRPEFWISLGRGPGVGPRGPL
jgi:hypothetical protein